MKTTRMGNDSCPKCGYESDSAADLFENEVPKPNSLAVCLQCNAGLKYGDDMKLLELTPEEFLALDKQSQQRMLEIQLANHTLVEKRRLLRTSPN